MTFSKWASRGEGGDGLFAFAFLAIEVMAAFTQMLSLGLFERYPRLRVAYLESGCGWVPSWLHRID